MLQSHAPLAKPSSSPPPWASMVKVLPLIESMRGTVHAVLNKATEDGEARGMSMQANMDIHTHTDKGNRGDKTRERQNGFNDHAYGRVEVYR